MIRIVRDDLTGEPDAETVSFSYEGTDYEIDLIEANRKKFHDAISNFIDHARRAGRGKVAPTKRATPGTRRPSLATERGFKMSEVRAWARENGMSVPDRGRVGNDVVEAYAEAMSGPAPTAAAPPVKKTTARKPAKKATAAKKTTARA